MRGENLSNRAGTGSKSVEIVRSDVGDWKPGEDADPIDVVVADPARSGLAKPGTAAMVRMNAPGYRAGQL